MTAPGAPSGPDGGLPPVGALADEAAQLLDALAVRLAQARVTVGLHERTSGEDADRQGAGDGHDAGDDPVQCVGWCPVCRAADLLRGDRPEVAGKLVDSAIVVIGALRSLLPVPGQPSTGEPGPPPPQPGMERIDIR